MALKGSYDHDVAQSSRSTGGMFSEERRRERTNLDAVRNANSLVIDRMLDPLRGKRVLECFDCPESPKSTPVAVVMDLTRSRGKDLEGIIEKMPLLLGQLIFKEIVSNPEISVAGFTDACNGDKLPIQVSPYETDNRIDDHLSKIKVQKDSGGGTGEESSELIAYYYSRHSVLDCLKRGEKGILFILTDEGPYPFVFKDQAKKYAGDDIPEDIPVAQIFKELQEKYDVFVIYPRASMEERKKDIDVEIQQRVERAGGQYKDVDIRASLIWECTNDLDLHMITPSGFHIFYGSKQSPDGGWLDVDMNVSGETNKPVENIRWKTGAARKGKYKIYINNYNYHGGNSGPTPFKCEVEVNGELQHFKGKVPGGLDRDNRTISVYEFNYDPSERQEEKLHENQYANYEDAVVIGKWTSLIPPERVLRIKDPRAIVDTMIGAIALLKGKFDFDGYLKDLAERGQTADRIADVKEGLSTLATVSGSAKVEIPESSTRPAMTNRGGRSKRI
jgi:hypothetical protein